MPKQRITIEIDTKDQPLYNGIEGPNNYHALEDFFVGLGFDVERIDYGAAGVERLPATDDTILTC